MPLDMARRGASAQQRGRRPGVVEALGGRRAHVRRGRDGAVGEGGDSAIRRRSGMVRGGGAGERTEAVGDGALDEHAVLHELELGPRALHAGPEDAGEARGRRVAEDVAEVGGAGVGPDGDGAVEALEPDVAPVLLGVAGEELEVAEDLEPLGEVELEELLGGAAEEAAAPAAAAAVRHGAADGAARGEEEEVDVRVHLADDGVGDVEVGVEGFEGDVGAERAVFPFVAEAVGFEDAGFGVLGHEHHGVEDAGDGGGGEYGAPDDAVWAGEVVGEDGGRVGARGDAGYVEDPSGALVCFEEREAATTEPGAMACPVEGIKLCACAPPASGGRSHGLGACVNTIGQRWHK